MKQEYDFSQLELRLAVKEDVDTLYAWANDPITRANSFNSNPIAYETHVKWFEKIMSDSNTVQFILMYAGSAVGQARLSIIAHKAEIGYSISEKYRGHGFGKALCQLLIEKVKKEYPYIKTLIAQVKPQNIASARCFQNTGFYKSFEQYELDIDSSEKFK